MITSTHPCQIAIVGRGRLGSALASRLSGAGNRVVGPLGRHFLGDELAGVDAILLCVPDREIPTAAASVAYALGLGTEHGATPAERAPAERCPLVGHCSGATGLDALAPLPPASRFSLHPLMTFASTGESIWEGAAAAVAATTASGLDATSTLARDLGLIPLAIEEADRGAYHAAASMASNFLITLELAAERLASSAGCERAALLPLVRATVENWSAMGSAALTGPIARGDTATVTHQRAAVAERAPELLELFDVMSRATRELAQESGATDVSGAPANATAEPVAA